MKLIKAVIRPEKETEVIRTLEQAGLSALTKWDVLGRGRQRGIQVGATTYGELSKLCLMLVVKDEEAPKAVEAILASAKTGHPGDGRIFVSAVKEAYTIRTGKPDA
ncbi:MAG: nitrogen fixation protein NifD [Candidatus Omnitrophica bacterium CG11_big_fil_rev_8_21_14_0_20_63_9]|nr:MAG: nitrogen fixation protein NifD [Candidatus Omnitrophica bacterium CG11_big_fil_rev_8_21_14_0_20_63_9]